MWYALGRDDLAAFVMRWWVLLGAVACAVAAICVVAVRSALRASRELHMPRVRVSVDAERQAFAEVPGLERVTLRTADGLALNGLFAPGKRRASVILVHGGGGNRLQLLPEARVLARHGYGVLLYDSRASGESDGDITTWGDREQHDAIAAVDSMSMRPDVDPNRICLLGFSIGGSTVALAAARDRRVRCVILYATWSSLEEEMQNKYGKYGVLSWGTVLYVFRRSGVNVENVRPIDHIREISPRPLLMIIGTLDDDTPVPIMERLFAAAGEPKELWKVPGGHHGDCSTVAPREYEAKVVSFLERSLPR